MSMCVFFMHHRTVKKIQFGNISSEKYFCKKCKIQIHDQLYLKYILKYLGLIVFKIHLKILSWYLKYYFKYMYFKILPITGFDDFMLQHMP